MRILVERTSNDTPNRHWDYVATVEGWDSIQGMGDTQLNALKDLVEAIQNVCDNALQE